MQDRTHAAPASLSLALAAYGLAYLLVCVLAGDRPSSLLFDAIPAGPGRKIAGLLLWVHVSVSYAINSQALCLSLERAVGPRLGLDGRERVRWGILTAVVATSSYLVANVVPFFKGTQPETSPPWVSTRQSLTIVPLFASHTSQISWLCVGP